MNDSEYEHKMRTIWPAALHDQITLVVNKQSSGAAHITTNCGEHLPPPSDYSTVVAAGEAIFGRTLPAQQAT
ncbi:MAG: hypothetical protein HQM06_14265 [Magnetococcales bacterium]|nr:hypothetical protein [Magnetococcales bacterium]